MSENKYYVYVHSKKTNGLPYYVGKGCGDRAWSFFGRNSRWSRTHNKHGTIVEIPNKDMLEEEALLLEMWLIAKFRHEGIDLCNHNIGGGSGRGAKHTTRTIEKIRDAHGGKEIYCSNGMSFISSHAASVWVSDYSGKKANSGNIGKCCKGIISSAYGFSWSYDDYPNPPPFLGFRKIEIRGRLGKPVIMDGKTVFNSGGEAVDWLRNNGWPKALTSQICNAVNRKFMTAYGHTWERLIK